MISTVLWWLLTMAPGLPPARARALADTVAQVTTNEEDAATLTALGALYGLDRANPFGVRAISQAWLWGSWRTGNRTGATTSVVGVAKWVLAELQLDALRCAYPRHPLRSQLLMTLLTGVCDPGVYAREISPAYFRDLYQRARRHSRRVSAVACRVRWCDPGDPATYIEPASDLPGAKPLRLAIRRERLAHFWPWYRGEP